jgi:mannose-6-phosphate isomerase-like protein (cupin superfamily)
MRNPSSKLLHFRGGNLPKSTLEYFVKEGEVPRIQLGTANILPGKRLPSDSFSLHDHQSEVSYVISGSCTFHVDSEAVVLQEGDVLYNPPGTKHFVENVKEKPCAVFWILVEE